MIRARRGAIALGLALLAATLPARAADAPDAIDGPAVATATARRSPLAGADAVSVSMTSGLTPTVISLAEAAAREAGAASSPGRSFSTGMTAARRGGEVVQQASGPGGLWQFPMGVTVLPLEALASVMGAEVAREVGQGRVVMSATSAGLRGARAGDVVDLVAGSGALVSFEIGLVAPDAAVGGTELVMSPQQADLLGADDITRILVHGSFDRRALDAALDRRGLVDGTIVRVRRSWDPPNPDGTIGLARTKALLGEFDYALTTSTPTGVTIDADWRAANVTFRAYSGIGLRASCHVRIQDDLQAALTEVLQAGLAAAIDVANSNSFGGCFNPRFNRVTGNIGFLSRHTWAQAVDINTLTNAQGRVPQMDCRVVRIFRRHGFAWGGNFITPDGMHFEWVGERRDTWQFPSEYCPNLPPPPNEAAAGGGAGGATQRDRLFADDGWGTGHG